MTCLLEFIRYSSFDILNEKQDLEGNMYKTIDGIYENGKITLKEKPLMKKAIVEVTFLHEIDELKLFKKVPDIFLNPVRVPHIKKISKKEITVYVVCRWTADCLSSASSHHRVSGIDIRESGIENQ